MGLLEDIGKTVAPAGGAVAGAVLGTLALGPIGTIAGAAAGCAAGKAVGDAIGGKKEEAPKPEEKPANCGNDSQKDQPLQQNVSNPFSQNAGKDELSAMNPADIEKSQGNPMANTFAQQGNGDFPEKSMGGMPIKTPDGVKYINNDFGNMNKPLNLDSKAQNNTNQLLQSLYGTTDVKNADPSPNNNPLQSLGLGMYGQPLSSNPVRPF